MTKFVERHGDHACQHVAFDYHDLNAFRQRLIDMGGHPRGETLAGNDGFGELKQMFAKGYMRGNAAEAVFPEYVQRPRCDGASDTPLTFSERAGRSFYEQIESAIQEHDQEPLIDFAAMPRDWQPPPVSPRSRTPRRSA